eukprot:1160928-Pelagomonas_calceolata.AAC.3
MDTFWPKSFGLGQPFCAPLAHTAPCSPGWRAPRHFLLHWPRPLLAAAAAAAAAAWRAAGWDAAALMMQRGRRVAVHHQPTSLKLCETPHMYACLLLNNTKVMVCPCARPVLLPAHKNKGGMI